MQYTSNYNLMLPEGTDTVNLLTQMNPNTSDIDAAMFANKQSVIGTASEVVSGTVHAITRSNTDSDYFKFTATGNWTAGDSMSVDGTACSVYLSDGTTPATGAYVINTEVLALLSGTRVTLLTSAQKVTGLSAAAITYDNTGSGLIASDAQDAIDELANAVASGEVQEISANTTVTFAANNKTLIRNFSSDIPAGHKLISWIVEGADSDIITYCNGTSLFGRNLNNSAITSSVTYHLFYI